MGAIAFKVDHCVFLVDFAPARILGVLSERLPAAALGTTEQTLCATGLTAAVYNSTKNLHHHVEPTLNAAGSFIHCRSGRSSRIAS